ncbi:hypothetical protein [Fusobacterium pseudoperiodonticum]|uniref:hypothetical protein n=1 Tax=Fusobacterium pseudoperiodonticum TaxID=2663009 RepID=UPI0028D6A178|nr:hypothetical protein [Fusobacterium pseudoperiodonticum]
MKEAKNRPQLKKLLLDESLVVIERVVINDRTEYKEVSDDIRNFLIEQIKGLDVSYYENGKQHFRHGYTYYYIQEKTIIPVILENTMPQNITWN